MTRPGETDQGILRRVVEWLTLGGLPVGALLSAVLMLVARLWLVPIYEDADMALDGLAALTLSWGWNLACVLLPLVALLLSVKLTRSTVLRALLGLVLFHVWLAAFLFTLFGVSLPALRG